MDRLPNGWSVDYEHRYLVLAKEPAIRMDDLDRIAAQMLRSQSVPGLLPIEFVEMDLTATLKYRIQGRKKLSELWRVSPVELSELYQLLHTLMILWEESANYLLQQQNILLHEDYIFVGRGWEEAGFVYVPAQESTPITPSPAEELKRFLFTALSHVADIRGSAVSCLLQRLQAGEGDAAEIKRILSQGMMELREHRSPVPQVLSEPKTEGARSPGMSAKPIPEARPLSPKPESNPASGGNIEDAVQVLWETGFLEDDEGIGSPRSPFVQDPKRVLAAYGVITSAIWLLWFMDPSEGLIYVCSGLQIILTVSGYLLWKYGGSLLHWKKSAAVQQQSVHPAPIEVGGLPAFAATGSPSVNPPMQTVFLATGFHTVKLDENDDFSIPEPPYLMFETNQRAHKVELHKTPFVIGRETNCDRAIDDAGISRRHLEIGRGTEGFTIQDLGSANGTRLNGSRLVPYKIYPLEEGDVVRVLHTEMVFHENRSRLA